MFIYSLPIFYLYIQLGTPQEYLFTLLFFLMLLYIATPSNPYFKEIKWGAISDLKFYQYLLDSWNGYVKLWLVFWPFFIILNLSLFTIDTMAKAGNLTVSSWDEIHLMLVMPAISWTIAVWRNALNTSSRQWAIFARFMTMAVFFEYCLKGVIRIDYPRIFFDCEEGMMDYVTCF